MKEKFSDFEGGQYLDKVGTFEFIVENAEMTDSKAGNLMVKFDVKCSEGSTTVYHVLNKNSRWTYNKLIAACLNLSDEQKKSFELDYETVHNDLVGKKFIADVEESVYEKEIKKPNDDGTYTTTIEEKTSYKINTTSYRPVED